MLLEHGIHFTQQTAALITIGLVVPLLHSAQMLPPFVNTCLVIRESSSPGSFIIEEMIPLRERFG